eukprot:879555-Prorocentrum_minimum.AAC.1
MRCASSLLLQRRVKKKRRVKKQRRVGTTPHLMVKGVRAAELVRQVRELPLAALLLVTERVRRALRLRQRMTMAVVERLNKGVNTCVSRQPSSEPSANILGEELNFSVVERRNKGLMAVSSE